MGSGSIHSHADTTKINFLNNRPRQAKKCLRISAKCAKSHHPVQAQSIIRAFALHSYILSYPVILVADSEGPDQTAQADLGLRCPIMPEDTFSHDVALIIYLPISMSHRLKP